MARGDEDGVVGGGEGAEPSGQEVTAGATVVAAGGNGGGAGAEPSGGDATAGATVVAAAGDQGVAGGSSVAVAAGKGAEVAAVGGSSSGDRRSGSGGRGSGRPLTPTVEELFTAAERASDGGITDRGGEEVVGGQFSETPVLRTATVLEPRSGDNGIGASRPVPFADGDFLEDAEPRDILDAFGLDSGVAAVLRDASMPEDRASALLLGALLSGASSGTPEVVVPEVEELGGDRVDAEVAVEVRVTAVD
ncbi:uncharacterized protein LOC131313955 [Rhododendron vialii]|uniref:uncharacterized protein LOC131313955 n=1 Tax=Rhododendron vialii TaxID=182163 RepID=UPI00265FB790|nr:uncharacterized protein LOC131313955 [Rhododendron vialii]